MSSRARIQGHNDTRDHCRGYSFTSRTPSPRSWTRTCHCGPRRMRPCICGPASGRDPLRTGPASRVHGAIERTGACAPATDIVEHAGRGILEGACNTLANVMGHMLGRGPLIAAPKRVRDAICPPRRTHLLHLEGWASRQSGSQAGGSGPTTTPGTPSSGPGPRPSSRCRVRTGRNYVRVRNHLPRHVSGDPFAVLAAALWPPRVAVISCMRQQDGKGTHACTHNSRENGRPR